MARKNRKNQPEDAAPPEGGSSSSHSPQQNLDAHKHERELAKHNTFDDQAFLDEYRQQLQQRQARAGAVGGQGADGERGLAGLPPAGSVLHLSSGEIAIFDRDVPSKNYQLVYMLEADGSAKPEGVFLLKAYEFEPIGRLPQGEVEQLREKRVWYRDPLVFYLNEIKYASLVPVPPEGHIVKPGVRPPAPPAPPDGASGAAESVPEAAPEPASAQASTPTETRRPEPSPGPSGLRRGQKFRIQFDKSKMWEAVYWGEDEQGTVVAHQTGGSWSFMHLDLKRFEKTLSPLEEALTEKEQYELAASVQDDD